MPANDLVGDLSTWADIFRAELETHLRDFADDPDVCGFAIELPSDFSNDGVISRVGKRRMKLPMRSHVPKLDDWQYVPNGRTFSRSSDGLMELYGTYAAELGDELYYGEFGDRLYRVILKVMCDCDEDGLFGHIDVKLLTLSDDEHPILNEAILALNDGVNQKLALGVN